MKTKSIIIYAAALFLFCGCNYSQTVSFSVSETVLSGQTQTEINSGIAESATNIAEADLTHTADEQSSAAENDVFTSVTDITLPAENKTISGDTSSAIYNNLTEVAPVEPSLPEWTVLAPTEPSEIPESSASFSEPQTEIAVLPDETKAEYDFSSPVPEGEMQEESYFDDAVFIGNSRMVGFGAYSGLKNITVYAHSGLNVRSIYDDACIDTEDEKIIILEALRRNPDFKKIYLKMGTNELGWPYYDVFIKEYTALIEQIKDICPDALIYVHSILPVAKKKSEIDPYENQPNINRCNELLQEMCAENGYFYLDVQSVYLDEEGYLLSSVTFDGSHIRYPHYPQWVEYLLSHTFEGCNMILPADDAEENNENIAPGDTEQLSGLPQNNGQQNDMQPSAE